ncbi:uncharacterized protein [Procambarus clarkii]|uniref:uncharacterized protein isoform X3 n=1 Tax=Procambarus clarkii TaxID=6728 RepID=UPI003742F0ED
MLKYVLLATLVGSACAGDLTVDQELYIVAGVLGAVCLFLTIVSIYNTVTIMSLQSKLRILKAKALPAIGGFPLQNEEFARRDPYSSAPAVRDDPSRRPPRDNYRMNRITNDYYLGSRFSGGPAPPPRPHRQESRSSAYY